VRERIYRWKFFQKALNNFLTSLTPFFFYSIGGYLVLEGRLTIGALVAALAAYKDISAPLRELFQYYQVREDVRIRYAALQDFIHGTRRQTGGEELVDLVNMERRTA
jgi:ABC-type bacteriocin/lantibiotic exporter with double-glycine peptidase domain